MIDFPMERHGIILYTFKLNNNVYCIESLGENYICLYIVRSDYKIVVVGNLTDDLRNYFRFVLKTTIAKVFNGKYILQDFKNVKNLKILYSVNNRVFNPNVIQSQRLFIKYIATDKEYNYLIQASFNYKYELVHIGPFKPIVHYKYILVMDDMYFEF